MTSSPIRINALKSQKYLKLISLHLAETPTGTHSLTNLLEYESRQTSKQQH